MLLVLLLGLLQQVRGGPKTLLMVLVLLGSVHLNASTAGVSTIMPDAADDATDAAGVCGPLGGGQLQESTACIDT